MTKRKPTDDQVEFDSEADNTGFVAEEDAPKTAPDEGPTYNYKLVGVRPIVDGVEYKTNAEVSMTAAKAAEHRRRDVRLVGVDDDGTKALEEAHQALTPVV